MELASLADSASANGAIQMWGQTTVNFPIFRWNAATPLVLNNRQFDLYANQNAVGIYAIENNSANSANTITVNTALLFFGPWPAAERRLTLQGSNGGDNTFASVIADTGTAIVSLRKDGPGKWVVNNTNTYTGTTTIRGGRLVLPTLANAGTACSIGAYPTPGPGGITIGGGTLQYTGGGTVTVDRGFTTDGNPAGIDLSAAGTVLTLGAVQMGSQTLDVTGGTGTLDLNDTAQTVGNFGGTGGTILNNNSATTPLLTIGTGDGGGGNYAGVIQDNTSGTGKVALTKTGGGTITLSGPNTYTDATTVNGGRLKVTGSILNTSSATVNAGTLELANSSSSATAATLAISNLGTLEVSTLGQAVGAITGTAGTTNVDANSSLTADSIVQDRGPRGIPRAEGNRAR